MTMRWRRPLPLSLGLLLLLAVLILAGPRVQVYTQTAAPEIPTGLQDLDPWLAERESNIPALRPATRKAILWANPEQPARTPISLAYLHGFSASRLELSPLVEQIAEALGANLFFTRLKGHGRDGAAMGEAEAGDWITDTREALAIARQLGDRVILIGTSTGATLALWAAAEAPERDTIAALVLLSPNLGPVDERAPMMTWPWGNLLLWLIVGNEYGPPPANAAQAEAWTTPFPSKALLPMMALVDLINAPELLSRVDVPTLVLHSPDDQVVSVSAMEQGFAQLGSTIKSRIEVPNAGSDNRHIIAGDLFSPATTAEVKTEILQFLDRVLRD